MQQLDRTLQMPHFVPDYIAASIADIDFKALQKAGVKYLAFDADSTLLEYRGKQIADDTVKLLLDHRSLFKGYAIASNRVVHDLQPVADSIKADLIQAIRLNRKPKKKFFKRVIRHFKASPSEIAMVGDKLVADMFGAKRMGLTTVWVERMGQRDSLLDRVLKVRGFERRMMQKYLKKS